MSEGKEIFVPPNECNEWGHPNDLWEFCGYDPKGIFHVEKKGNDRSNHWA